MIQYSWEWFIFRQVKPVHLDNEKYYYLVGLELHNLEILHTSGVISQGPEPEYILKDYLYSQYAY